MRGRRANSHPQWQHHPGHPWPDFSQQQAPTQRASACHKNSMLRADEKIELNEKPAPDEIARRKTGARRTAWIIAALALAFFVASLVQGHFSHIPH